MFLNFDLIILIKFNVMIQLTHQATLPLTNKYNIDQLNYENRLLTNRNQLLSQQNQRLLKELDLSTEKIRQSQEVNTSKLLDQLLPLMIIAKQDLFNSLVDLGPEIQSKIKVPLFWLKKQIKQPKKHEILAFMQNLIRIIKKLAESSFEIKQIQSKRKLKQSQERLIARKTARHQAEKYIHVVKEPNQLLIGNNVKYLTQQIAQQRQFFEKLIQRVKKDSISTKTLSNIFEQLDHTIQVRNALRNEQAKLSVFERQIQLGFIESTSLNETIQKIEEIKNQLSYAKGKLKELMHLI